MPDLTLVIPCFNESARIVATLTELVSWFPDRAEILLIDDGSTDDTFQVMQRIGSRNPAIHIHRLPQNRGKGGAIRAAVPLIRTSSVVFVDADLAFDRVSLERVILALSEAEVAVGNRRHHQSRYSVPVRLFGFLYRRHLVGLAFNACVRALVGFPFRDTQCGLKAFRSGALRRINASLTSDGFAVDVEILLISQALGLRIAQVPVEVTYHSARSSVRLLRSGAAMSIDLFRIAARRLGRRYSPERLHAAAAAKADLRPQRPPPRESNW